MSEAGQRALNVKSKVESAESILAELETDFAKFDYSSYTQPIKIQTQNVADRTGIYNSAVSKYEQKTQEMDDTFSNELIAATPMVIPVPFDLSCLELGDQVHMKEGDIINFLEEYNTIDLGGKLSDAQLENILAMLFDKKDFGVTGISKKDFEVAFLNLTEEKQKAILMEMGLTRRQIDSILESKESKRSFANQFCDSKTKDRFNNLIKNSKFAPKTTSKNGGGNSQTTPSSGSSGQSGYNNGTTQCDSDNVQCAYPRLMQTEYDELSAELNEAAAALCDDDPSNDAEALKTINENLDKGFYYEYNEDDKQLYLKYDTDYLDYCKETAGEGTLLYELLDEFSRSESFGGDGTISVVNDGTTSNIDYSLELSHHGAGYMLTLNVNNKVLGGNVIEDQKVAYAATKETAEMYFIKDGALNYDAIGEWFKLEGIDDDSIEYSILAREMTELYFDQDLFKILELAEYCTSDNLIMPDEYKVSNQLRILAMHYQVQSQALQIIEGESQNNNCTRAIAFRALTEFMFTQGKGPHKISYTTEEIASGKYKYIFSIDYKNSFYRDEKATIEIYPFGDPQGVDSELKEEVKDVLNSFYNDLGADIWKFVLEQTFGVLNEKLKWNINTLPYAAVQFFKDMEKASKQNANIINGVEMLDDGNAAQAMKIHGSVAAFEHGDTKYAYIGAVTFDYVELLMCVEAYNREKGTSYTVEEMKDEYFEQSDAFKAYVDWYCFEGGSEKADHLASEIENKLGKTDVQLKEMKFEDLEEYVQGS